MEPVFCSDCGCELCEHGYCAENCSLDWHPDNCDCFDLVATTDYWERIAREVNLEEFHKARI